MSEPVQAELRLAEVVLTAAELEAVEQDAYLKELATSEPELAAEARRRLLAAEDLQDSFLATPAAVRLGAGAEVETPTRPSAAALPAATRYELGEELGRGGMGRVVKAFDQQLGRPVALKFLTHDDPDVLRLFLQEARHQARVRHDHVLEIYDSGEIDGQPFISMQYAAEGTLSQVASGLPLEGKIRLLRQAAEGLHAAHRQGLLHRDVKPSNILVERTEDGDLRALVTDFGLATEIGAPADAEDDAIAGSPQYIAPERLLGPASPSISAVDRRSDVYSLGITLFRLLTGDVPFKGSNTVHVLSQVANHQLPPPRQVKPDLPVELEAIILRATAGRPEERYTSARAVAEDLQRYLDGEVVEAYTAGLAYRLTRFVQRHRLFVGMAAALVLCLVIASIAVTVFALRADAARKRAEMRHGQAEELIHFMVFDLRDKVEGLGRLDILTDLGSAAMDYFAAVPDTELSETELLRRSRMLYQIGDVRIRQGDLQGAAAPLSESLALALRLAELRPDDGERLFELGQAYFWVGFVSWEQGDLEASRGPFEDYLDVSRRLVALDPTHHPWRQELSYAHSNLGSLLQAEGHLEAALEQFETSLSIDTELVAARPTAAGRSELAATHNTVGTVLRELGRLDRAERHLLAELEIRQALVVEDPENLRGQDLLGASHGHLGVHFDRTDDRSAGAAHFQAQRDIFNHLAEHDPANTTWQYKLAMSHLNLGLNAAAGGDVVAAEPFNERACRQLDALLALDAAVPKWRLARTICSYQRARLRSVHDVSAARAQLLEAVQVLEDLASKQPQDRETHRWLTRNLLLLGRLEEDRAAAWTAFERAEAAVAPLARGHHEISMLALWTEALVCLDRLDEAVPALARLGQENDVARIRLEHCPGLHENI